MSENKINPQVKNMVVKLWTSKGNRKILKAME